ncbi:MAG TPA: UPF0175 family protein [Candidatus Limnocylindrales bacterium]|nr:UPF0175 family protein [Candidatus Limnocylindrales bacterium]
MSHWVKSLELNIPKALVDDLSADELKLYLAIILYRERKISVGQAAKLAGLKLRDFMYELGKHKESFTNITPEELDEELRRVK